MVTAAAQDRFAAVFGQARRGMPEGGWPPRPGTRALVELWHPENIGEAARFFTSTAGAPMLAVHCRTVGGAHPHERAVGAFGASSASNPRLAALLAAVYGRPVAQRPPVSELIDAMADRVFEVTLDPVRPVQGREDAWKASVSWFLRGL